MTRPTPRRSPSVRQRGARWLLIAAVSLAAIMTASSQARAQQSEEEIQLLAIEHDASGELRLSIRTSSERSLISSRLTVLVDGVPRPYEVQETDVIPLSVVLAIDTSGSMLGTPIEAARRAASDLVDRLRPDDRVALLSFSSSARLLRSFESERDEIHASLSSLVAEGSTALYDAVVAAVELLADREGDRKVLVLLTDGRDFGGVSSNNRDASIAEIRESGARVFTFALGANADVEYLRALAEISGGAYQAVADDRALAASFQQLGGQLGSTGSVTVSVPPLSVGEHSVSVTANLDGDIVTAGGSFAVTNAGLLTLSLGALPDPGEPIVLELNATPSTRVYDFEATAAGQRLEARAGEPVEIVVNPWDFAPGSLTVSVDALARGGVAATSELAVPVPALDPELRVRELGDGTIELRALVQADPDARLIVSDSTGEIASARSGEVIRVSLAGDVISLALLSGDGAALIERTIGEPAVAPLQAAEESAGSALVLLVLLAAAAIGAVALIVLRRRRDDRRRQAVLPPMRRRHSATPASATAPAEENGEGRMAIIVRDSNGNERRYDLGPGPVTIGRSSQCDIVIDDDAAQPVHARLSRLVNGDFRVHLLGASRPELGGARERDLWLVARPGEELEIGRHVLTVVAEETER